MTSIRLAAVGITPPTFKASGGISAAIQLTKRVARLCDSTMFVMSAEDSDSVEDGLRIVRHRAKNRLLLLQKFLPRSAVSMSWRPDMKAWLRHGQFNIAHFHNPHPPGALLEAAEACVSLNIPYVISTHGFIEFNEFSRGFGAPAWQRPIIEALVRRPIVRVAQQAARILMLSPQEKPVLLSMGVRPENLRVVTNGVDPYFAARIPDAERESLISRFRLPTDRILMFYVGNHTQNKGIDILLKALPLMKQDGIAVIAGAIRSKREHEQLLADCNIAVDDARVRFTDFITREELRALYQSVNLFVFPSRADTLPLVILEAMVSGLPIVSTEVGGIPYEVGPDAGILVQPRNPAALAEALDRMCGDESVRLTMASAARARVTEMFVWERSAERAVSIYREVLG
jgi:alpha-maltose-1-phosphate synthase